MGGFYLIVTHTLAILTLITHVRVGHAGELLSFTKENYPDPRVQFQACNRPGPWEISHHRTSSPASNFTMTKESDFTMHQLQNVWSKYAQRVSAIVYHVAQKEVFTEVDHPSLTALCICQTRYEASQYLATGDVATVLDLFTQKFIGVLSGTSNCSTTSNIVPYTIDSNGLCSWTREITISSLEPRSGLPEGRTEVVITGQNLDLSKGNVLIGPLICPLITRTSTKMSCQTPALQNMAYFNITLPVFLLLDGTVPYNTGRWFIYTKPALIDVQPLTTTISGGLQLTVQGTNLNLVKNANMTTLLRGTLTGRQNLITTQCQVRDSTSMLCPTPTLDIESVRSQITRRHVRGHRAARLAVADSDASAPVEDVAMSVMFGVNGENLALQNGQSAQVTPYANPVLYPFEGEQRTLTFISLWPKSERMVDIKGTGLLPALKDHTLKVEVGAGYIEAQVMASNLLVWNPPIKEPEKKLSTGSHPAVTVHVGNLQFDIGYLQYYDTLWKYPVTRYSFIFAGVALLLILIVIIVCCGCKKKKKGKKNSRKRSKEKRKR